MGGACARRSDDSARERAFDGPLAQKPHSGAKGDVSAGGAAARPARYSARENADARSTCSRVRSTPV